MSRVALPSEKVLAVAGIYKALWTELWTDPMAEIDPRVQVAMLDAATRIAMGTDTRDMGLLSRDFTMEPAHAPGQRVITVHDDGTTSDDVCDDCGGINGQHNLAVEH